MSWFRSLLLAPLIAVAVLPALDAGGKKKPGPTPPRKIVVLDKRFAQLLPKKAKVETIARGFIWTEGPAWNRAGKFLVFSDIPHNVVHKWQKGKVSVFVKPSGYTGQKPRGGKPGDEPGSNGLLFDADGRLTLCEHGDRRVTRIDEDGKKTVLADNYMGKKLNSPNDLVYHTNGDLYFTDPPYGLPKGAEDPTREMDYCGVYLRKKDGKLILLTKEMTRPNGIALSPDQKTLYVANSDPNEPVWKSFPVKEDGTLGKSKLFVDGAKWVQAKRPGLPDGMKIDVYGNLWATGPGGVWVFAPDGTVIGNIDTGTNTANVAFGDDGSMLYIAANHDICRVKTLTKGKGF
ncbi:MAG: SMP-30/gluconolactonase/LRE family protein [Planctomycetes bacterium]|nr:SMP-30/gluconolactonase/LRE family protein [Planctomycetota bacterium]